MTTITAQVPAGLDRVHTRPGTALRDVATISRRNLRRVARTPRLLVVSTVPPVLFVVLFRYVFGGAIHTPDGDYAGYLLPTILILTQLLGATTAVALATDLAGGMVDRFRSLPIARSATLAGRTIADLARATLVLLVGLGTGVAVGFRFHTGILPGIAGLALVLAFSFAMSWEMAWIALKVKDPETAQVAGFLPVVPFVFASSGFVPVTSMPGWLQGFANTQPFSVTISAVRALTQGGPTAHYVWQSAAWIAGIGIVFGALAIAEYRKV
jgi:ABC-2 type transport system permease protein/oleandomycin transport system permease protein